MITKEMIPRAVIADLRGFLNSCDCDECMASAIAAALNAWQGTLANLEVYPARVNLDIAFATHIILPLTALGEKE